MVETESSKIKTITDIICLCCREISKKMRHCNPTEMAKFTGIDNISGDHIKYLDDYAQNLLVEKLSESAHVYGIISEEHGAMYKTNESGDYIVAFDPIDGSSNIEFNITTGTIYGVYKVGEDKQIKSGKDIVASGYGLYGSATEFVYTDLEDDRVKMIRTNEENNEIHIVVDDIIIPEKGQYYSVNHANSERWLNPGIKKALGELADNKYSLRYVGSMVADIHRVVMNGGVFLYPGDTKNKTGKIRYYYEAYPLALIIEKIGGKTSNFQKSILDLEVPKGIHDSLPVLMGSKYEVDLIMSYI